MGRIQTKAKYNQIWKLGRWSKDIWIILFFIFWIISDYYICRCLNLGADSWSAKISEARYDSQFIRKYFHKFSFLCFPKCIEEIEFFNTHHYRNIYCNHAPFSNFWERHIRIIWISLAPSPFPLHIPLVHVLTHIALHDMNQLSHDWCCSAFRWQKHILEIISWEFERKEQHPRPQQTSRAFHWTVIATS